MAETGNPQFVLACSPFCSASGVICSVYAVTAFGNLVHQFNNSSIFSYAKSDYKWSINVIIVVQSIGVVVGSIAPIFRSFTAFGVFSLSRKWSMKHVNLFKVEKHWTQRLRQWKRSHVLSLVVICKTLRLIPSLSMIVLSSSCYLCNSFLKRFKRDSNESSSDPRSEMKEYNNHVIQLEKEAKLSNRVLKSMLKSITKLLLESEEIEPRNLIKFLEKSTGFDGVVDFESDKVPPLHSEKTLNCWSLVVVTQTAIAIALPNIAYSNINVLLSSMKEGLQLVRHIEESLNANGELRRWLEIDLQKKARKGKTSKEILQWLGDEAVKIVIQFKKRKNGNLEQSRHKFIAANTMYKISQTILIHCNVVENWPKDEELFEWISNMIADILFACFTNLPQVITMKCNEGSLEKREESIRTAAQLLGKSKKILNILQMRHLPTLDPDTMAYIDEWHALLKSQNPNGCASLVKIQSASSNSNEFVVII
ncbi:uncharacterized protein [Rutidosis leptorrhynchoides]|uniref:uncharacterized protein n=1 Tax=Rutidosis leptorrhynchoides TaxID=125765 RepID=UPI003A9A07AA